jgi:NitT/TauT family transport system permease protein
VKGSGAVRRGPWPALLVLGGLVAAWEGSARAGLVSPVFFPAPSIIAAAVAKLTVSGELLAHLGATLSRVLTGFALGALGGLVAGLGMGWSGALRRALDPLVAAAHPIPKIALLPLIMLIVGIGERSKVIVVAVGAFFPMLINTMEAVRQIRPGYFEVAQNYGASVPKVFTRVVIPGSLPLVLAGARLAFNIALLLAVAVELITAREGLGAMIWLAWQTLRSEELYTGIAVIAAVGVSFNALLQALARHLIPWQADRDA